MNNKAEETLRRYELLKANSWDIILFVHRGDGRILEANAAATMAYGYSLDELLSITIHDLRAAETRDLTADQMAQADSRGILFETVHRRKDGNTFPAEVCSQGATIDGTRILINIIRDITNRWSIEKEIRSLARYPEENPNPVLRVSDEGVLLYANRPARVMIEAMGWSEGMPLPDLLFIPLKDVLIKGGYREIELTCRPGTVWSLTLLPNLSERHITLYARDVTAQKQAEGALRVSEERYRILAEASQDVTYVIGRDDTVLYVNNIAADMFRKEPEEIIGRKRTDFFTKEINEQHRRLLDAVYTTGEPSEFEGPIRRGGKKTWQLNRLAPLKNKSGETYAVLGVSRDITDRKRIEDELCESEEKYRILAEASEDFIFVLKRDDTFAYVNSSAKHIIGKKPEDLIGKPRSSLGVTPEMLARQKEANDFVFATGEPQSVVGQYLLGQNRPAAWHSVNLVPLKDADGEVWALLGVARDITELRERAQRLEEANIALKVLLRHREEDRSVLEEQFLANFRKLILPSLEKLRRTELNPRKSAYVDVIEMNVRKMFADSKAEAGHAHVNFTPMEMRIIEFIKEEKKSKEIADLLNLSPRTVEYYRDRIRKKLGLKSKNINLRSYLYTFP
jgi:PAS domain S-box-containing protein